MHQRALEIPVARARLERHASAIETLVRGLSPEEARWRPAPDAWSIVEVVNHLADEEREDFRSRLDLLLHHPGEAWSPIDPPRWAVDRRYIERDLDESLDRFLGLRSESLSWLARLEAPDATATYEHPTTGPVTVRDLLASWVAHDLLHVRQIVRIRYRYLATAFPGASVEYAGPW